MLIKKDSITTKKLEAKYVFRRKINFFMKNHFRTFFKKSRLASFFKQTVHPFNKSYIDFSGSNNPKGENHESNRAKEVRKLP